MIFEYAKFPPPTRRAQFAITRILLGFVVIAVISTGFWYAAHRFYVLPRTSVEAYLRAIPGVRAVNTHLYDEDGPQVAVLDVVVVLDASTGRTVRLHRPDAEHLRNGQHILLDSIGTYSLAVDGPDGGRLGYVDVGRDSPLRDCVPFKFRDAAELISRYEEVSSLLGTLPPSGKYIGHDGSAYQIHVLKMDDGGVRRPSDTTAPTSRFSRP